MLGCPLKQTEDDNVEQLPRHGDEDQVQLDVDRSFVYYPEGTRYINYWSPDRPVLTTKQVIRRRLRTHAS